MPKVLTSAQKEQICHSQERRVLEDYEDHIVGIL